jgi:hypothetical protein
MREWRYSSNILVLGTRWRSVVIFTLRQLYPKERVRQYPFDRRLGGPQSPYGPCKEEKNLAPAGNQTQAVQLTARWHTDWSIPTRYKYLQEYCCNYCHAYGVTIDGVYIGNRNYWALWYSACLRFTFNYYIHRHTTVHSNVFTSRCLVAASNGGRSSSFVFRKCPRLQLPESQRLSRYLTWPLCPACNISPRTAQETSFIIVVVQLLQWEHACLRSRYSVTVFDLFVNLTVVSQQRVYMSQCLYKQTVREGS